MDSIILAFVVGGLGAGFLDGRRGEWWLGVVVLAMTAMAVWRVSVGAQDGAIPLDNRMLLILAVLGPAIYLLARWIGAAGRKKH